MPKRFDDAAEQKRWLAGASVFIVLALVGFLSNSYVISLMTIVLIFTFMGQSWNLMLGIGGQLSIGHALFVGTRAENGRNQCLRFAALEDGRSVGAR